MLKENEPTALTSFNHVCGHTYLPSLPTRSSSVNPSRGLPAPSPWTCMHSRAVTTQGDNSFSSGPCSRIDAVIIVHIHVQWPHRSLWHKGLLGVGIFLFGNLHTSVCLSPPPTTTSTPSPLSPYQLIQWESLTPPVLLFTKVVSEVKSLGSKPINPHLWGK